MNRLALGAAIGTPYGTAWRALYLRARARPGETVLVHGASGGGGTAAVQIARALGMTVIGTAGSPEGLAHVLSQGAHHALNHRDADYLQQLMPLTGGRGVDVAFEVIGLKETVQQAFSMARRGGQAIIVGVPKMEQVMEIPIAMDLLVNEKQVRGSWYGSSDVQRDVPHLIDLYKSGTLKLDELVSRTIGLGDVNDAFRAMEAGEVARSVIDYDI